MATNFQLYIYTVDEYRRFANLLPVKEPGALTDNYSESDYVGVQVRLMLLRKYYSGSKNPANVSYKRLITEAKATFPLAAQKLQALSDEFDQIESQQVEQLLMDGTKLNLYDTIEDVIYGLYLHADASRINRLENTAESARFFCTRKYVLEIERIVFELYDILVECGVNASIPPQPSRSPLVYLGDARNNTQSITGSPYWSNIYGHDATEADVEEIAKELTPEEAGMLYLCMKFTDELKKDNLNVKELRKFIHPAVRSDWGNFQYAKRFYCSIPNPGLSTKVRYNEAGDTAYIRIFPKVDDAFVINTPHVFSEGYEFALGKWFGKWRIYSFGGHLDSIFEKKKS